MSVVYLQKIETSVNQYTVNITWDPVDSPLTGYELEINGKIYNSKTNKYTLKNASVGDDQKIRVRARFADGVGEWSGFHTFTVKDVTKPTGGKINGITQEANGQSKFTLTFGNFSDNDAITGYNIYVNGKLVEEKYSATEYIYSKFHDAGEKINFEVAAVDAAGNESKRVKKSYTVLDKIAPEKVTNLKVNGDATEKSVVVAWDKPADKSVTGYVVYVDGAAKGKSTKTNSITLKNLGVGNHTVKVVALDKAKNESVVSETLTVYAKDITAPKGGKLVLKQTDAQTINLAISGDSDNDKTAVYKFFLNGKEIYSGAEKSFDYVNEEMGGKLNFTALVIDASGNVSKEVKSTITVKDMTDPGQVKNVKVDENANEKSAVITWDVPYDNVGVTGYIVSVDGKEYKSTKNTLTVKKLAVGSHTVTVKALDKAKNAGEESQVITFWASDVTAPKAGKIANVSQSSPETFTLDITGFTDNAQPTVTGYNIFVNGAFVETVSGNIYDYSGNYAAGSKINFEVQAFDDAGNKSKKVKKVYTVQDMIAPEKVTGLYVKEHTAKKTVLDWDDAKDNVKTTRYAITVRDAEGNVVTETTSTKSEVSLKGLAAGDYKVVITASDKAGNKKVSNNEITIGAPAAYAMRKPGQASENADDTWANAMEISENDGILAKDFWLCGEELADNSVCGFADSVDYMKFTKTSDHSTLSAWVDSDNEGEVSIELLDASGNTIDTIACWSDYSLEELKNGIYGIKVKVDENTHVSGMISVY